MNRKRRTRNDLLEEFIRLDDTGKAHPAFNQTLEQIVRSDHEPSRCNALSKIAVRQILNVPEVKLHKAPPWLTKRLRSYLKKHDLWSEVARTDPVSYGVALIRDPPGSSKPHASWLDHWGTSKGGRYACCHQWLNFVSEPYEFGSSIAASLDAFCNALDLTWHVSSNTWWNPGATVRITIHPKEDP